MLAPLLLLSFLVVVSCQTTTTPDTSPSTGMSSINSSTACNEGVVLYNSTDGEIMFSVPDNSSFFITCNWLIYAPADQLINVQFISMNLDCYTYSMYVYNGNETAGNTFHCGTDVPRSFTATNGFIRILLVGYAQILHRRATFHVTWNTTAACQDNEFRCWSGKCIPQAKRCDESRDCDDDSDEITCAQNSTQANQCGTTSTAPGFTWAPRIVGGDVSSRETWPWQVKVQKLQNYYFDACGGTVIDKYWILTSATCVQSVCELGLSVQVPLNASAIESLKVEKIHFHEHYNNLDVMSGYNIALLRLAKPITFSSFVRPVCLSNFSGNSLFNQAEGMTCIATGFGHTNAENNPNYLDSFHQVRLPILDSATCLREFNELRQLQGMNNATSLPGGQFCAGHLKENIGTCKGDHGGPLVCLRNEAAWYQVGIAAFRHCEEEGQPSFFTDISYFSNWINSIVFAPDLNPCGSTHTGPSGRVLTPNYPLDSPINVRCQWTVIGPNDHNLVIKFDAFELPNNFLCSESYVEIYDGDSTSAQLVFDRRHCGIDVPPPFEASSNKIIVIYHNIATSPTKGFSFRYTSEPKCNDATEFRCWDGTCIAKNFSCDDIPHCDDGSDEIECAKPSTPDQCGTQTRAPAFQWAPRIVGGSEVVPHSYPWQVMLARRRNPYSLFCSGSIVAMNWVLTAAHCVEFISLPSDLYLYAGKHNSTVAESTEQRATACEIYMHESYGTNGLEDDIALVKIRGSFEFNDYVRPICIERLTGQESGEPPVSTKCVITGWGYQRGTDKVVAEGLRQVITKFQDNKTCNQGYQGIFGTGEMPPTQLCAGRYEGGISSCNGDSGGPMVCLVNQTYWHQVGIVSYGSARGCALPELPSFFTRVSSYVDWIDGVQKRNNATCAPICGKALRKELSGNITSPGYPLGYEPGISCRWEIQAPEGLVVHIDVAYLVLYGYYYSNCSHDFLKMYDGGVMVGDRRHCSSSTLQDFESLSNNVTIMFGSSELSYNSSFYKFLINYQIRESICGDRTLTNETGNLTSPGYPLPYPTNAVCRWVIKSPEDKVIEINFLDFDIYAAYGCPDFLQIYDGTEMFGGNKFCGTTAPRSFAAYSSNVTIVFSSGYRSSNYNNTGFHLSWKMVDRCLLSEHTCWNGTCIPGNQHCDGVQHCNDNSDEIECGHPTANFSECGKPSVAPGFTWDPRIIGGNEAKPGSWPWQVGLSSYRGSSYFYCGGSIINEQWVVTSASCVSRGSTYVNYGVLSGSRSYDHTVLVIDIRVPQHYLTVSNGSNIALLKVETSFKFTNTVRSICLPDNSSTYNIAPGTYCIATGWGMIDSQFSTQSNLHQVRLPIISNEECAKAYGNQSTINDAMICAGDADKGGIGTCWFDFGGPLACLVGKNNWNLIGISSFGSSCNLPHYPGVHTRVSSYTYWIQKEMTSTGKPGICDSTTVYTSLSGNITSPGYPGNYPRNLDCRWSISVPETYLIVVKFREFSLEASYRCQYDYVNIYIGSVFYTGRSYCRNRPGDFLAASNNVTIVFHSDFIYESSGFLVEWTTKMKCPSGNFSCWNGECLDGSTQCNGVQDCSDNSDEIECSHSTSNHSQCGKNDEAPDFTWDPRIAGGSETTVDSWPWQASIYRGSNSFSCGGSVLNDRWVMSSALCVEYTLYTYYVRVGRNQSNPFESTAYQVVNVIKHPLHSSSNNNLENNIALLRTSSQMILSSSVRPVCLPSNETEVKLGMHCIATGWGRMSSDQYHPGGRQLYQVRLPILKPEDCTTYNTYNGSFNDGLMCAGYLNRTETGTCYDDQGGPLACLVEKSYWVQMGVATRSSTCAMSGRPSIFVRTAYHKSWIEQVLADDYMIPVTSAPSSPECGAATIFSTPSGTVTSPEYPLNYPNNIYCEWTIVANDDRVIEIIFNEVELELSSTCQFDYLAIYDLNELYNGRKFCGKESLRDFAALSTSVRIVFHTDISVTEKGFSISWTTSARCQDDEYTCGNGACIPQNQQCDGSSDCDAGDDEHECVHVSWNQDEDCGKVAVAPTFTWDHRIVGGNEALPGSYPWMAMLRYKNSSSFICGASIINKDTVLTAAHCVEDATSSFQVVVGVHMVSSSYGEQVIDVNNVISHPNYDSNGIAAGYDIAILKLEQRIVFNGTVRPVCLPRSASGKYEIKTGKQCIATGWGHLSENHNFAPTSLFQVRLPIVDKQMCVENYANESTEVGKDTICAGDLKKGGIDTCQGDSGGPLVCRLDDKNWYQIGIRSFDIGCGRPGLPGVYTTVSDYYQWIVENIGEPLSPATEATVTTEATTNITYVSTEEATRQQATDMIYVSTEEATREPATTTSGDSSKFLKFQSLFLLAIAMLFAMFAAHVL